MILNEFMDRDYLMEEFHESKAKDCIKEGKSKVYIRGRVKKWFDFEIQLRTRKHQEYLIFLGLDIRKGFKVSREVPGICRSRGIKRK